MDHHHTTSEYYTEVSLAVNPSLTIDDVLECNPIWSHRTHSISYYFILACILQRPWLIHPALFYIITCFTLSYTAARCWHKRRPRFDLVCDTWTRGREILEVSVQRGGRGVDESLLVHSCRLLWDIDWMLSSMSSMCHSWDLAMAREGWWQIRT